MFELPSSAHVALDHLLAFLDIGVTHFTVCDIRAGWGMRFDACKTASLHYCLAGVGTLGVHDAPPIQLEPHTFVLLPPRVAYRLESASPTPVRLEHRARLCGISSRESVPTLTTGEGRQGIATACGELRMGLPGGSEDSLAMIAGMSRSAFAAAFRCAFGQSPMSLVKLVRLRRASELLVVTTLPVADVAKRVGFSSRSNFSLAFGQLYGMDPSRFRRTFLVAAKEPEL